VQVKVINTEPEQYSWVIFVKLQYTWWL